MDTTALFITIFTSIVGGGALLTFVQFMITRKDTKDSKYTELVKEIKRIDTSIQELKSDLDADRATNARIRILSFSDEIRHAVQHSKESFDQIHQDIDQYNRYCRKNPDYENSRAVQAIENIESVYARLLREDRFLT